MSKFVFSIIIAIYNTEKYLRETFDSIINQSFDFERVQLILVDDGSTDGSGQICKEYQNKYPNNIKYIYKENGGQTTARNLGVDFAEGKYINFLDSDDKFELNCFEEVYNFFNDHDDEIDVVSTPRYFFEARSGPLSLNYRFYETRVIDIQKEYNCPQLSISCVFIRRTAFDEKFDSRIIVSEDATLVNKIILKRGKYGVVNSTKYLYRRRFDEDSTIDTKKLDKRYFCPRVKYYMNELINCSIERYGHVIRYVQFCLMFDLQWMYEENNIKSVLNHDEFLEFESLLFDLLQYIDDDIIISQKYLDRYLKCHILKFKHGNPNFIYVPTSEDLILKYGDFVIDVLNHHKIELFDLNIENDILSLKGVFDSCFENVSIKLFNNGIPVDVQRISGGERFALGNQVSNKYYFKSEILLSLDYNAVSAEVIVEDNNYPMDFKFNNSFFNSNFNVSVSNGSINIKKNNSDNINIQNEVVPFEKKYSLDNKNEVFTLWISDDDTLPEYPYLSLKSMVLMGHDVILYTYKHLKNIPDGVIVKDANEVMDKSLIFRYKNGRKSYSGFANYFRLKRLYELGGTWIDLDIILIKNINDVIKDDIAICSEPHHQEYIHCNNAIIRFPKKDSFVKYMYDYAKKRGKDVNHGETGPHLITKNIFHGKFTSYAQFIRTPIFNNILGWWEINQYFNDPKLILNNVDLSEVVGFHLVNTFFSSPEFNVMDKGIYGALKYCVLNSSSKQEYENNLKEMGIIFDESADFLDYTNLQRFHSNNTKFTFIIDSNSISKLDLYLIMGTIEKSALDSFEFIIFGITDIINERLLYKDNAVFITSPFSKFKNKLANIVHGEFVIPISNSILFKNNWFNQIDFNNGVDIYNVKYLLDGAVSSFNIFTKDVFEDLIINSRDIFNCNLTNFKYNYRIDYVENNEIYGFKNHYSVNEYKIITLVDSLFNFNIIHEEFLRIKKEISNIYINEPELNLSFYYLLCCSNLIESNTYDEFLTRINNFILKSNLHWEYKSENYLKTNYLKENRKLVNNVNSLNDKINSLSNTIEEKNVLISNLQEDIKKKDDFIKNNESEIKNISQDLDEFKRGSESKDDTINSLNTEIGYLKNSISETENQHQTIIENYDEKLNKSSLIIEKYKQELLSAQIKNDCQINEIKSLHKKLDDYETIFNEIMNSNYYKIFSNVFNNHLLDDFK